jgi:cysteine desulfurase/selenocysteine lyase
MLPVNVSEMNCHAYATSGHKWLLGPKATGLLYVREDALDSIQAKWVGAYSNTGPFDIASGQFQFHQTAQRYEYGTASVPLFVGLGAAMDFLLKIGMANVWRRDLALATALHAGLSQLDMEVLSPPNVNEHSSMITVRIPGVPHQRVQAFLAKEFKLRTRGIYEAGLNAVRISLHVYNSFDEIKRIIEGVEAAQKLR